MDRKEISGATVRTYIKAIRIFCEMCEIQVPWKKIMRGVPRSRNYANDRAPTIDEIRKITNSPDRRIKPIVYFISPAGIRLGVWDYLRRGHIQPTERDGRTSLISHGYHQYPLLRIYRQSSKLHKHLKLMQSGQIS